LIWEGIVVSSEAGARGGLGGLSLAKDAKKVLEESLKLDEKALSGSAYTSLAALYAKVPGWPLGFGDKKKAEELFLKSLNANPDGIDPNFFYGEYLIDQERVAEGRGYLEKSAQGSAPSGTRTGGPGAAPGDPGLVEANCRGIANN
jgi:tetratricopeptide (TPR) repeat protein